MMKSTRRIATVVGILFLTALILNLIATEIFKPILDVSGHLKLIYLNKNSVVFANLLNFICALAMIFIPIKLFPVVRKDEQALAITYIVFRALEGVVFIFLVFKTLLLISLSQDYQAASADLIPHIQLTADSIQDEINWATNVYILIFTLGGFVFYSLLYKSRLVPRFLSVWGILAVLILFAGCFTALFNVGIFEYTPLMEGMVYFAPPIALNEFVLSIWLIARGFAPQPDSL